MNFLDKDGNIEVYIPVLLCSVVQSNMLYQNVELRPVVYREHNVE